MKCRGFQKYNSVFAVILTVHAEDKIRHLQPRWLHAPSEKFRLEKDVCQKVEGEAF